MDRRENCSKSKLEQETITIHLLCIPEDSSGEFWNGKEEGVDLALTASCLSAMCLFSGDFLPRFVYNILASIPTPISIWRLFSLVPRES